MEERLQKLISQAGVASRRQAEELIREGEVSVNGEIVRELGTKADASKDHIKVKGKLINPLLERRTNIYVLLNKPKGYLSSVSDPEQRPLVTDLLPESLGKLYPVGRLDFNTEGLILLTNDGELTNFITQAKNKIAKVYEVKTKGVPPEQAIESLRRGVLLEDGFKTASAQITMVEKTDTNAWYEVILKEGHNQQIRKMFDTIGFSVIKLKRVQIGHLSLGKLRTGKYYVLEEQDIKPFYVAKDQNVKPRKVDPRKLNRPKTWEKNKRKTTSSTTTRRR